MDCLFPVLLFVPFVSLSLFLILLYRHRAPFTAPNLPPGRIGYPVIGETLESMSAGRKGHPEKFILDRMIKYSSEIFKTSIIGYPTIVFGGAAANKFLFSNENKLVTGWVPGTVNKIFILDNPTEDVKKYRGLVLQFFKPEALQRYVGAMDTIAQRHFAEHWENRRKSPYSL